MKPWFYCEIYWIENGPKSKNRIHLLLSTANAISLKKN